MDLPLPGEGLEEGDLVCLDLLGEDLQEGDVVCLEGSSRSLVCLQVLPPTACLDIHGSFPHGMICVDGMDENAGTRGNPGGV